MTCGAALTSKATPFLSGVAFFCASFAGNATPPSLSFPVDCRLGETCFIQQYVDHDPSIAARDYTCGPQSYDGHQGTDFRLSDLAALTRNVAVLAAANGIVQATRDGVLDQGIAAMPEGQDCGNGVVIDHGDGWQSQYCQLAQGSIAVTQGQNVQAGARLGVLGLSGRTEFPHLHFTLRHNGTLIDPFNQSAEGHCGLDTAQLWHPALPAPTADVMAAGFSNALPDYDAIRAGRPHLPMATRSASALVVCGFAHSGQIGDRMEFEITGPNGALLHENNVTLERAQAQFFRASGRRAPNGGWGAGRYIGEIRLIREGELISIRQTEIELR